MTTLKQLTAQGGFAATKPVKKHIAFEIDGNALEADIFVRQIGIGEYEDVYLADDKDKRSKTAKIIAESVTLGEDGKERISFDDAYRMKPSLASAILDAFNEVNGAKKSSAAATGSSATSA
jgi:hypothetical protein